MSNIMNKFKPMSEAAFVASLVGCAAMLYATADNKSVVLGKGYFDDAVKYVPDNALVFFATGVGTDEPEHFAGFIKVVDVKGTKKKPAHRGIEIVGLGEASEIPSGGDPVDLEPLQKRLDALENVDPVKIPDPVDLEPLLERIAALEEVFAAQVNVPTKDADT